MLVLTRSLKESIVIGGNIRVMVVQVDGNRVRLAIDAPDDVTVHREEIQRLIDKEEQE